MSSEPAKPVDGKPEEASSEELQPGEQSRGEQSREEQSPEEQSPGERPSEGRAPGQAAADDHGPALPPQVARPAEGRRGRRSFLRHTADRLLSGWEMLLERPVPWAVLFVLVGGWVLAPEAPLFVQDVTVGSIATRDYEAPRELFILDEEATRAKQRRAREEVLPVYDFDSKVIERRQEDLERLFAEGRRFLEEEAAPGAGRPRRAPAQGADGASRAPLSREEAFAERLADEPPVTPLKLTPEHISVLLAEEFSPELEDRLKSLVRQVLSRGVVSNKTVLLESAGRGIIRRDLVRQKAGEPTEDVETAELDLYTYLGHPGELRELLEAEVRAWSGIDARKRRALVDFLSQNLQPNLNFNQSETRVRQEQAAAEVERVFSQVRKGQVVVRKGDEITPLAARAISQMTGKREWDRLLPPLVGHLVLLLLVVGTLWLGLKDARVAHHSRRRLLSEGLLVLVMSLLGLKLNFIMAGGLAAAFDQAPFDSPESYLWAVPFSVVAFLGMLLCGRHVALMLGLLFSVLASRLPSAAEPLDILLYSLAGSLAAIFAVERFELKQRLGLARIGVLVGLVQVLTILVLLVVGGPVDRGPAQIGFDVACGFAGGLLAAAVVSFTLPILEALFSFTTDIKLIELANTNLPLLRRLAFEAPGTFQHSIMVANLAKEGCEAIGADTALAYTGALYHDIGKVLRPEYFIENQRSGGNPHDHLQPSMSVLILVSHIKDGLDIARKHHLPRPVLDAIEQHHGTRKMTYFLNRAQERCDADDEVAEEKYRYPGPRPRDRVMGVLMLADGVEAASRTLVDATPQKISGLIERIVQDCVQDGQLDLTDLTLRDLEKVSEAFLRVLSNLHHRRVDYPGFDFNAPGSRPVPRSPQPLSTPRAR